LSALADGISDLVGRLAHGGLEVVLGKGAGVDAGRETWEEK
jgi:hypothetical protein